MSPVANTSAARRHSSAIQPVEPNPSAGPRVFSRGHGTEPAKPRPGGATPLYEATRHSFATLALASGTDQYLVQRYLGHTDPKTTERYVKLADTGLIAVLPGAKLSPDRLRG